MPERVKNTKCGGGGVLREKCGERGGGGWRVKFFFFWGGGQWKIMSSLGGVKY